MSNPSNWTSHLEKWPQNHNVGPICVHAEGDTTANIILMAKGRPLHICHVARKSELGMHIKAQSLIFFPQFSIKKLFLEYFFAEIIKAAKNIGLPITCEVCPHHLFLTEQHLENNFLGPKKGQVRPCLVTEEDRQFLWDNFEYIDTIGSDHAPHTLEEKENHR